MKEEFIAGRNPVAEALRSGRALNKVMVQDGARGVTEIIAAAKQKGVSVEFVKSDKLDKLAQGVRHQGVVAYAAPVEFKTLEDALKKAAAKGEAPFLLLLDELQDPQNLGALIRTADAAGVHGILLPKRRSCPLNAVVAKISAGAVEYVPVIQIGNIVQQLKDLKKQGFWVAGADMDGEPYTKANLTGPLVLVIGAEGKGLGRLVKENCDIIVSLPMQGGVNSLNAAAAGAVLMYDSFSAHLMPLINSSFAPGQAQATVDAFQDPDQRQIAQAELYYFSGRAQECRNIAELYLQDKDLCLRLSAGLLYSFSNLTLGNPSASRMGFRNIQECLRLAEENSASEEVMASCVFAGYLATVLMQSRRLFRQTDFCGTHC